ncbi:MULTISPECIES: TRAP transporter small permease subunit [unclassified Roseovarius]|uniref:TRAP transporter small permease subunit n=1 Tax=unclassified Roseovarius TaxID=2614913 RepID=UPI00273CFEF6|nr:MULTISPECIES: TRAP transporter small permease subunit [unclassified Roseovarius]
MQKLLSLVDRASKYLSYLGALALIAGMFASCYEVFARYVLSKPTIWSAELVQILFGSIFLLCAADNIRTRSHVAIDFIQSILSRRANRFLAGTVSLVLCVYAGVFLKVVWNRAITSISRLETSNTPWNPPVWPLSLLLIVAVTAIFLQSLVALTRNARVEDPDAWQNDMY